MDFSEQIAAIPKLTPERYNLLATQIQAGREAELTLSDEETKLTPRVKRNLRRSVREGQQAKQDFVLGNLKLVISVANRYQGLSVDVDDLIQEGTLGLITAVDKFDFDRGIKFSTYAMFWIRRNISRALAAQSRTIRVPEYVDDQVRKAIKTQNKLEFELGRPATTREIAERLEITVPELQRLMGYNRSLFSIADSESADARKLEAKAIELAEPQDNQWEEVARVMTDKLTLAEEIAVMNGDFASEAGSSGLQKLRNEFLDA